MARPIANENGRDYGRRLYVSRQDYQKQMRRLTDAHADRGAKTQHSAAKKPYLPDQGYQEMEYFNFPWDGPQWPGLPGFPDTTDINDQSDVNGFHGGNPPKDTDSEFLGCEFIGPFSPAMLNAGDTATAKLARRDDPIVGFTVHGPATLLTGGEAANCTSAYQRLRARQGYPPQPSSPECTIILIVDDPIDSDKWGASGDIAVVAHTLSGSSCSSSASFVACGDEDPLTWDDDTSGDTIIQSGSSVIAVLGGRGPFYWSVSGTDFSLSTTKTSSTNRSNTLNAGATACGIATITVEDSCGNSTTGVVRCTTGQWVAQDFGPCLVSGPATSYNCTTGIYTVEDIEYKCDNTQGSVYLPITGVCSDCDFFCTAPGYGISCSFCATDMFACDDPCHATRTGTAPCCTDPSQPTLILCIFENTRTCYKWEC